MISPGADTPQPRKPVLYSEAIENSNMSMTFSFRTALLSVILLVAYTGPAEATHYPVGDLDEGRDVDMDDLHPLVCRESKFSDIFGLPEFCFFSCMNPAF